MRFSLLIGMLALLFQPCVGAVKEVAPPPPAPLEEREISVDGYPYAVVVDEDGSIYFSVIGKTPDLTAEDNDGYLYVLRPGKSVAEKFSMDGDFSAPKGLAIDKDNIYVIDIDHLMVLDKKTGKLAGHVNFGTDGPMKYLNAVVLLGDGRIITSCTDRNKLYICDPRTRTYGELVTKVPLNKPSGLAWDAVNKVLYVGENDVGEEKKKIVGKGRLLKVDITTGDVIPMESTFNKFLGQYGHLQLQGNELYFSDWAKNKTPEAIQKVNLKSNRVTKVARAAMQDVGGFLIRGNQYIAPSMKDQKIFISNLPQDKR